MSENSRDAGEQLPLNSELAEFAGQLRRLEPRDDRLDRERVAFLAGQASMAERSTTSERALGRLSAGQLWPAAFVAMTGVAATLFVLLVMRPTATVEPPVVSGEGPQSTRPIVADGNEVGSGVLTTRGVWARDPERFLTKLDGAQGAAGAVRADSRGMPVFTPAAWQQVIEESDTAAQSSGKSSEVLYKRGVSI